MQRLFTMFAEGWPGLGLLVQRLVTGIALLYGGTALARDFPAPLATQAIGAVLAIFIMIGFWTPVAGALIAAFQVWTAFAYPGHAGMAIVLATLGATLAMIGPGAFSLDARLFGRKHISR